MLNNNVKKNVLINFAMLAVLILLSLSLNINSVLSMFSFLVIIPMVLLALGANIVFSISSFVLVTALTFIIYGGEFTALNSLTYLLPALLTGLIINNEEFRDKYGRKFKIKLKTDKELVNFASIKVFLFSIVLFILGLIAYYLIMKFLYKIDFVKEFSKFTKAIITQYKSVLKPGEFEKLQKAGFFDIFEDTSSLVMIMAFLKAMISAIISYFICIPLYKKAYNNKIVYITFDNIILPGRPVIVLFISIIVLFLLGQSYPELGMNSVINNYILVMNILFFIEGLSLITFVVKSWKSIKNRINWLLIVFLIIFMGILPGISILGMLDNVINFRKKWYSEIGS
ncbi:DUF2232 domain-containing protein [Peptostreptococcus canis]|uniref:DUF2232 domain-containing protein n=1 Tax=Peptostreptococcus canis TaxID=1159213 RepID=A0ABR6TPE1_9FIRM|nr:DUF2232 domain-containing protein [Peptostreptococcus canis]MBC2576851.1 DUF2232 domain-containing protein [Peptostreptococcus canis]MBP1998928.1 hypothetical protein [Peptostreptococcus canis]